MALEIGVGFGCVLKVKRGGGSFVEVAGIVDTIENDVSVEGADTTLLNDLYKSSLPTDIDPGTMSYEIALDNAEDTNQDLVEMMEEREIAEWQITYSNNDEVLDQFFGWVKTLGRKIAKREMLTRKVEIQITGNPGFGTGTGSGA